MSQKQQHSKCFLFIMHDFMSIPWALYVIWQDQFTSILEYWNEETARNHKNFAFSRKTMLTICGLCPITLTRINCFLRVNKFHIVSFWTDEYLDGSLSFFYFVWIRAAHRNGHRSSLTDFAQLRRTTCSVVADIYYDASCCRYF